MTEEVFMEFEEVGPIVVATVEAEHVLDALNADQFGKALLGYVNEHPGLNLLLNFEHVDYLSSAVLTELLRTKKALEKCEGSMRLCSLNIEIRKVFNITNLDQVFTINKDLTTALDHYKRALVMMQEDKKWERTGKHIL